MSFNLQGVLFMNFKFALFLAFSIVANQAFAGAYRCQDANGYFAYSDKPCAGEGGDDTARDQSQADIGSRTVQNSSGTEAYPKNREPMRSPDAATQACFSFTNTTARFPDPSTTKLLTSSKKWVAVRRVGARQMVSIGVTSMNEAGMYVGVQTYNCLLMGDGLTVNTSPYELM
jgi:hypothetical protein